MSCDDGGMKERNKSVTAETPAAGASELLTDREAAALLAIEPRTLRLWRATRGLPHLRITSKIVRYRRADLDSWLERRRVVIGGTP